MNAAKVKAELTRLHNLLRKYSHRWCVEVNGERQEPSQRMYDWVDQYNALTDSVYFKEWCEENDLVSHDAYDVLA